MWWWINKNLWERTKHIILCGKMKREKYWKIKFPNDLGSSCSSHPRSSNSYLYSPSPCSDAGRWKTLGGPVVMVGIICPPPVWIGLTDLPNIGGPVAPLAPPVPASLPKLTQGRLGVLAKYDFRFSETLPEEFCWRLDHIPHWWSKRYLWVEEDVSNGQYVNERYHKYFAYLFVLFQLVRK